MNRDTSWPSDCEERHSASVCRMAGALECPARCVHSGLVLVGASLKPALQVEQCDRDLVPAERALPHDGHSPPGFEEVAFRAPVPLDVVIELRLPELGSCRWRGRVRASCMPVPETAVKEANGPVAMRDKIGGSGQIAKRGVCIETPVREAPVERPVRAWCPWRICQPSFEIGWPCRRCRSLPALFLCKSRGNLRFHARLGAKARGCGSDA